MIQPSRRRFLLGITSALAAPAIVRFESLMPVKVPALIVPKFTGVSLCQIRDELLPGLFDIRGSYDMIPREWDRVFDQHEVQCQSL